MRNKTEIKPEKNIVIKRFRSRIARDKERYVLSVMDGSGLTPRLYDRSGCCLTMEYRPGQLISDILYCPDTALVTDVLKKLADWLTDFRRYFYRQTGSHIVLEDINPRNFIYNHSTGRITGIDFESWHTGEKTENYISLLTMVKSAHSCDDDTSRAAYDRIFRYCGKFFTENPENVEKTVDLSVQGALNRRKAMTAVRKTGCAILAGGKSSRMGSDKGMLPLGEYTFIDHIICNAQIFDSMCISGDNPAYSCFGLPLVGDNYAGCGPLGALQAVLTRAENTQVAVIPCDMPFVSQSTLLYLFSVASADADAVVFTAGDKAFPTVGIYRKTALPVIEAQLTKGDFRLMHTLKLLNTQYVPAPHPHEFVNINTPRNYNEALNKGL